MKRAHETGGGERRQCRGKEAKTETTTGSGIRSAKVCGFFLTMAVGVVWPACAARAAHPDIRGVEEEGATLRVGIADEQARKETLLSSPVGYVRLEIPSNATMLVSMPFVAGDNDIHAVLKDQMTGSANARTADRVLKWDTAGSAYTAAVKTDGTGDSGRDGRWHSETGTVSDLRLLPGEGFFLQNRQAMAQTVYLAGELNLAASNTVPLAPGLNLIGYPYAAAIALESSGLWAGVTNSGDRVSDGAGTAPPTLQPGEGYWYIRCGDGARLWVERRPAGGEAFLGDPPGALRLEPPSFGRDEAESVTLAVACPEGKDVRIEVYSLDIADRPALVCAWERAAVNLKPDKDGRAWWTDQRPLGSSIVGRCYAAGRGDVDADGNGEADAWDRFSGGTAAMTFLAFDARLMESPVLSGSDEGGGILTMGLLTNAVTLTWDKLGNNVWQSAHWLGGPPTWPGRTENAVIGGNVVTVGETQEVNIVRLIASCELKASAAFSVQSLVVSNGSAKMTYSGAGYVTSDNTETTPGRFAYELFLGAVSAPLQGEGVSLRKGGTGIALVSKAAAYTGQTRIDGGSLRMTDVSYLPAASWLNFNGGALATKGTLSKTIGTGPGQVCWTGNGGFGAYGGALTVNLNGGAVLDWGSETNGFNGKTLILNSSAANDVATLSNPVGLKGDRTVQTDANVARLTGVISNGDETARKLTKTGAGILELPATNTFSGGLAINAGVVSAHDGTGLPSAGILQIAGGQLETAGTFTRDIGNAAGKVYWSGSGGFAARGGDLTLNLNGGSAIDWSSSLGFNGKTLILGSSRADGRVALSNAVQLKGNRTITVNDNTATNGDYVVLSGALSDGDGTARNLIKNGAGLLVLEGTNTYTGATQLDAGMLRAVDGVGLPAAGLLRLNGNGVLESRGMFSRAVGNAAGRVYWNGSGGFAAAGGPLTVSLNGGATLNWAAADGFNGKTLVLGSPYADDAVELRNSIMLDGDRAIYVNGNVVATGDVARLEGNLEDGASAGKLTKRGSGELELRGTNLFTGGIRIEGGTLRVLGPTPVACRVYMKKNTVLGGSFEAAEMEMEEKCVTEWRLGTDWHDTIPVSSNLSLGGGRSWTLRLVDCGGAASEGSELTVFTYGGFACCPTFPGIDASGVESNVLWDVSDARVVNDIVGKRVYVTGLRVARPVTVGGTVFYDGYLTGDIHVVTVTNAGAWATNDGCAVAAPGAYEIADVTCGPTRWIKAWMDVDGDGARDSWEPSGSYTPNPVSLTTNVSGMDVVLLDSTCDGDQDGMSDAWEMRWFGSCERDGTGDYDGDGLMDLAEFAGGTDPTGSDTDADGFSDWYEVRYGLDPLSTTDAGADPDGDGIANGLERVLGSNPFSTDSDGDGLSDAWEYSNGLNVAGALFTNLVSWWRFDEASGTIAYDDNRAYRNDGTLESGASRAAEGVSGRSLFLDGDDDCAAISDSLSLCSTGGLTLALWVKAEDFGAGTQAVCFVSKEDDGQHVEFAFSYVEDSRSLRFSHCNSSDQSETVSVTCDLGTNEWMLLSVTVNGTNVAFYTNAVQVGTDRSLEYPRSHLGDLIVGNTLSTNESDRGLHGLLDELRFFNRALTAVELAQLLDAGADGDADGLTNREEYEHGADPDVDDTETDSDGDSISNADEILVRGTNPFSADTDGDGMNDAGEIYYGKNPLVADQRPPFGPEVIVLCPENGAMILW